MCKRTADCMCERTARDYSATACRRATPHTFFIWLSVHIQRPMVRRLWLADLRWLQLRLDLVIFLKVGCAAQQARSADTGGSHLHTAAVLSDTVRFILEGSRSTCAERLLCLPPVVYISLVQA